MIFVEGALKISGSERKVERELSHLEGLEHLNL